MADLAGKTVLLTGASRGIGRETVRRLVKAGAHVVAQYGRDEAAAEESVAGLPAGRTLLLPADFSERGSATRLWDYAIAWRGSLDVLVCNAAVMTEVSLDDPEDVWDDVWATSLQVNAIQPAHLVRHAIPHFVERGAGTIIALSSWVTQRGAGNPDLTVYGASKAALASMLKTIARTYAKDGVLTYTISPGVVDTEMSAASAHKQGGAKSVMSTLAMGERVPPGEIADLVTYLASGACRHLCGATLDVNGASYIR